MDRVTAESISNNLCFRTSHVATTWQLRVNHVALLRLTQTYRYKYTWDPWTEERVTQCTTIYVLGPGTWRPRGPRGISPVDLNVPVQVDVGPMDRVTSVSISNNVCFRTSHVATKCKPRGFAPVDSNVPLQVHMGPMDRVTSHVATTFIF